MPLHGHWWYHNRGGVIVVEEWVEITNCHSVLFPFHLGAVVYGRLLCEDVIELMIVYADGRVEYQEVPRDELLKRGFFCPNR